MTAENMVHDLLTEACDNKATDIYFFPYKNLYRIETRSNSYESRITELTIDETLMVMNYLKFNGGLDVSERRRSQKGSFGFSYHQQKIHIRISSVGDFLDRESLVVRLIYPQNFNYQLNENLIEQLFPIAKRKGMMIFSGPMGSGKTSLMYALCKQLSVDKKIMSIEDPVEIVEDDFLQLQVNEQAELTYEELIKTSLRHRPEVLIIGEIRDAVTAEQAIQAALCGYTVMTTIHGKSKFSVIQRLKQFGVDPDEILNAINLISYQRLVPTVNGIQLFNDTLNESEIRLFLKEHKIDDTWSRQIKHAYQSGYISAEVYQEYLYG
ncbi:competence type IV pilus ATPase ComGA [Companilactobacillus keshanensis]|uniref:Competence type IV pilus ATPase ComGA n=1 Tax=Companilactobacillus keshanensis TaxID=2486003 RepID=A0ABW4BRR2_9LACO|nr:competence type IV pilus ATPase ComGA [Companilactobacillus keshanensis]